MTHLNSRILSAREVAARPAAILSVIALCGILISLAGAPEAGAQATGPRYVPNEVLVQFVPGATDTEISDALGRVAGAAAEVIHTPPMRASGAGILVRAGTPARVPTAIAALSAHPAVVYAEPNWIYEHALLSNDPYYTDGPLWGMYSGQSPPGGTATTNQYGSGAELAWDRGYIGRDVTDPASVYVGVIDQGIQYDHTDLAGNVGPNPGETLNGIDDDGNGYVDDIYGWDFHNNDNSVYDSRKHDEHGTHVSGTIGAVGGNGKGVVGVNWKVKMLSGKFLGPAGGTTSNAIKAVDYFTGLKTRGVKVVATNNSWGGGGFSQGLLDAIVRGAQQNILFIAAAGNSGYNNDTTASYPSNYDTTAGAGYDAVIAVAALASNGTKPSWSNYGKNTVDLGAPGSGIYSTVPDSKYASFSGTSMAAPHVTGAVALYAATNAITDGLTLRTAVLSNTTTTQSLTGITVTDGRLDIGKMLP